MKAQKSSDVVYVREAAAAKVLTSPKTLRQISPFIAKASSVPAAALLLGEKPNSMQKRVNRWLELGLIKEVDKDTRGQRPLKLYRSVQDIFYVPFDVTSADNFISLIKRMNEPYFNVLYQGYVDAALEVSQTWGMRLYRDNEGEFVVSIASSSEENWQALNPEYPAILDNFFIHLNLDFHDAKALQFEMIKLLQKYEKKTGNQPYTAYIGLAPKP